MSNYNLSVKQFIEESKAGNIDYKDFAAKYQEAVKQADKKFSLFNTLLDLKPTKPEPLFYGLPVSFKDSICVKGVQSAAGSRILEGYKPTFDSTVAERVKGHACAVLGKTNQDEFGFGTFSTNSGYGIPKNPLDPTRSCGGSAGGAAGIVAALDLPHIAIGESTGGSISSPASFCGVAGLTPTYGLVSRYGLIDYANSMDKIGPIGKSVWDIALMLSVIAGPDPKDPTTIKKEYEYYPDYLTTETTGLKIGIPKEYFSGGVDKKVADCVWDGIKKLESLGVRYEEVSLPHTKYSLAAYYIIATAEASTNLAKYSGIRYGAEQEIDGTFNEYFSKVRTKYFGKEAKRRVLLGTFARMAGYRDQYYMKALKVRTLVIQDFKKAFKKVDALVAPTMPVIAPKFSEIEKLTPLENYAMDILTVAPNLAGIPMLSVPCGQVNSMPVGLHIMGNHLQEKNILKVGYLLEKYDRIKRTSR